MIWWKGLRLRWKIFAAFAVLVAAALSASLGFTQLVVGQEAERTLKREVRTTGQVFATLLDERATRLRANSTLLASDFALKRVLATHFDPASYDPGTLVSAGLSYRERAAVQLVLMTDETGVLLGAAPAIGTIGRPLASLSPLKEALATDAAATAIAEVNGSLYQMVATPVFAPDVIGFLLLGDVIDNPFAARLKEDTRSDVTFLTASRVFASTLPAARAGELRSALQSAALLRSSERRDATALKIADERFLSLAVRIDSQLSQPLYALIQGSYDEALAPLHALQWRLAFIAGAALVGVLLTGIVLAGGITGPIDILVESMREVLRGNLRHRTHADRTDELGFLARSFNQMVHGLQEREQIKDTFGRFVSRDVAEAVLNGRVSLAGERLEASILFQDIRGFTALSEQFDPVALLSMLNRFFTEVVVAVEAEGGVVKQFTGDGVMALFGAPQVRADHSKRAVRAALGISERLTELNRAFQHDGIPCLRIGIGVHTGEVVAGLIGPDERVEYGVVGDPVNLASRIEMLTKEVAATILVSKQVADQLGPEFALGRTTVLAVKGKSRPVEVIEVLPRNCAGWVP